MNNSADLTFDSASVPHPGDLVVEYLEAQGWSQRDLARRTGLTPKTISEICNGKAPITPATALALEKVLKRPAHFWLNLQRQFDEAQARHRASAKSSRWIEWTKRFPIAELKRRGWITPGKTVESEIDALLMFLGVTSPDSWDSVWNANGISFRQTRKFATSPEAISVWARATELRAAEVVSETKVAQFDEKRLRSSIEELRHLTRKRASEIMEPLRATCAAAGVIVVLVPELPHTAISGCARWLTDSRALIALTLRYKTDDQMWFTFFHELGHILLHKRRRAFVIDNPAESFADRVVDPEMQKDEDEANRFSADTLIPPKALADFIAGGDFGNQSIHDFAEHIGIGPGLVVGRLQFEGLLAAHQGNALKQRLEWTITKPSH